MDTKVIISDKAIRIRYISPTKRYYDKPSLAEKPELPQIGHTYLVWTREWVGPRRDTVEPTKVLWSDDPDYISQGLAGNNNPAIRRTHGWRGTTNDVSVDAHGVRRCEAVDIREYQSSTHYTIRFGPDLHPEVE